MRLLVVNGATLTTGVQGDTVTILPYPLSLENQFVEVDGEKAFNTISFTVTLADTSVGAGVLIGNSEKVLSGGIEFVLEDAEIDVICIHPTSGATTTVTVSIDDPGQEVVLCD